MGYLTDREAGESPRESDEISTSAWRGILAKIRARITDGSFSSEYPQICPDGNLVCGTNTALFLDTAGGEIPGLELDAEFDSYGISATDLISRDQPPTLVILDLIQFCWKSVSKPIRIGHHSFYRHDHLLDFDQEAGRKEFRADIETIFRRNDIVFTLTEEGSIERLAPPVYQREFFQSEARAGDDELNRLLGTAQRKILDPNPETRQEALEALWDAWERLKTLDGQGDKKAQTQAMLDNAAGTSSPKFRDTLEREAVELTSIGNSLRIRHSETNQETIARNEHRDYLFYRLYSLVRLILQTRKSSEV